MADEETFELEVAEEDILYRIVDEQGNEVGIAVMEDGQEVEYYYAGLDEDDFEVVEESEAGTALEELLEGSGLDTSESIEIEISEDDIVAYLNNEEGEEIGFVIMEDGQEIECYYEGFEEYADADVVEGDVDVAGQAEPEPEPEPAPEEHGYLYKMASIAGFKGNKARKKAEVELDKVRGKAEKQAAKASTAAKAKAQEVKGKADEAGIGITREDVTAMTGDLNAVAREGAETAKELKEAYDDIMDTFSFLKPGRRRR